MDPITRVRMHGGFYYDFAGRPNEELLRDTRAPGFIGLTTLQGQHVQVNIAHVVVMEDLSNQPKLLADAMESAERARRHQQGEDPS